MRVAELSALKGTDLPGATIDAHGVRITLWGISVEADMTEGIQKNAFCLEMEESKYNGSGW